MHGNLHSFTDYSKEAFCSLVLVMTWESSPLLQWSKRGVKNGGPFKITCSPSSYPAIKHPNSHDMLWSMYCRLNSWKKGALFGKFLPGAYLPKVTIYSCFCGSGSSLLQGSDCTFYFSPNLPFEPRLTLYGLHPFCHSVLQNGNAQLKFDCFLYQCSSIGMAGFVLAQRREEHLAKYLLMLCLAGTSVLKLENKERIGLSAYNWW